jgi:chemotaxis protein methyltransferase CheR
VIDHNVREFEYRDADFERVKSIIYRKAGINLADSKKQLVYSRLARRLRALNLLNFSNYLHYLESNPEELEEFVNALTTNLTSFFREEHHFKILAEIAGKWNKSQRNLRVWCAASSTGEEPYSIAITLAEAFGRYDPPVEIIASDIDSNVLREANAGVYPINRIESLSYDQKRQFFQRGKGANSGKVRVIEPLRKLIDFRKINLLDSKWPLQGAFDVIFCRNVMIYFDKPTQITLLERMIKLLSPDGIYIAGHSESFSQASHLVKLIGKTTYKLADSLPQGSRHGL